MTIKKVISTDSITFNFNGDVSLECPLVDLPEGMLYRMALHGIAAKCGDAYSKNEGSQDALQKAERVWGNLKAGVFNAKSQGGGSGKLAAALVNVGGKSIQEVMDLLQGMDDKTKKLLRNDPKVKTELARMELAANEGKEGGLDIGAMFG